MGSILVGIGGAEELFDKAKIFVLGQGSVVIRVGLLESCLAGRPPISLRSSVASLSLSRASAAAKDFELDAMGRDKEPVADH